MKTRTIVALFSMLLAPNLSHANVLGVFSAAGDLATVTAQRDAFRTAVGGGTVAGANGSFGGLRREINWDGVPANFADPNELPANFFNVNSPRGVVFQTPGTGFMVSANAGGAVPIEFGVANQLQAFSAQRLFTALNSNITDVSFFLPGTTTKASTTAFGVVFTDVDVAGSTKIALFDANDVLITEMNVQPSVGDELFSFLGIQVSDAISRVRITSGTATILANGIIANPAGDLVAMDDFLYAEPQIVPQIVPEPSSLVLLSLGLAAIAAIRRKRS